MSRKDTGVSPRPAYDMPPPNAGLPYKGGLAELCRDDAPAAPSRRAPPWAFAAEPGLETWLDPRALERALDDDPRLARLLAALAAAMPAKPGQPWLEEAFRKVEVHVARVFDEVHLPALIERFRAVEHLVLQYVLAKAAARVAHPARFPADTEGEPCTKND